MSYPVRREGFRPSLFSVLETLRASRRWIFRLIMNVILGLRPGTRQDPLKNSSGLLVPSVGVQPSEGWSEGLYELSPLSSKRSVRAYEKILRQQARIAAGFVGEEGIEPSVQIIAARCSRLSHGGGQGPAGQTNTIYNNDSKHPRVALYTCFLYRSSYVSSVSSPVPLHLVQMPFFQGCSPVPPHSGQRIGSGSSMALSGCVGP